MNYTNRAPVETSEFFPVDVVRQALATRDARGIQNLGELTITKMQDTIEEGGRTAEIEGLLAKKDGLHNATMQIRLPGWWGTIFARLHKEEPKAIVYTTVTPIGPAPAENSYWGF